VNLGLKVTSLVGSAVFKIIQNNAVRFPPNYVSIYIQNDRYHIPHKRISLYVPSEMCNASLAEHVQFSGSMTWASALMVDTSNDDQ
jgi:hypothetical protein